MLRALAMLCLTTAACGGAPRPAVVLEGSAPEEVAAPAPAPAPAPGPRPAARELRAELPVVLVEPHRPVRTVVTTTSITILDQVRFVGPTADLHPSSHALLDALAQTLLGNPSIRLMEVTSTGAGDLGLRRAERIVDYLVAEGIEATRLRARAEAAAPGEREARTSFYIVERD